MCGIAGVVGELPGREVIDRMVDRLHHRGPDDRGVWRGEGAHLGHARLAILDLSSAGHQPMEHSGRVITYNGEIYNFRELRRGLPGPFRSDCDTEVVLRIISEQGESGLPRLHLSKTTSILPVSGTTLKRIGGDSSWCFAIGRSRGLIH